MRPIERIDNFLSKIDWKDLLEDRWGLPIGTCGEDSIVNHILGYTNYTSMENYWKENPDQRIGQVLINLELVPSTLGIWIDEEANILKAQGLSPEEYLFWTSYLDKDENILEKPITKLVKDLTKEHILAIKAHALKRNTWLSSEYNTAFNNVLANNSQIIE